MNEGREEPGAIRTDTDDYRTAFHRGETRARIVGVVIMSLVVVAALSGYLGPRDATVSTHDDRGVVEITHPHLTRPGLDTEVVMRVAPSTTDAIRLLVDAEALSTLGTLAVHPAPDAERSRDGMVEYEFTPAGEGPYEVRLVGRVPPKSVPTRLDWEVIWVPSEGDRITLAARTWVLP